MARASLLTKLECAASPLRTFNEKRFIVEKLTGETSRKKVRWREREINKSRERQREGWALAAVGWNRRQTEQNSDVP